MSDPSSSEAEGTPPRKQLDRTKLARLIALVGVLAMVLVTKVMVLPHVPEDHEVEVQLPSPGDVVAVDVRWTAAGTADDITMTSLRFSAGSAPSSVLTKVRLPDGAYEVAIDVERLTGVDSTRRRITLENTGRVTIPLR